MIRLATVPRQPFREQARMVTDRARRRSAIALLCAASALALTARSQPSSPADTPFVYPASAVWPGGGSIDHAVRQLWLHRTAAERLHLFPDSPHTVGWLSNADRMDDALAALARERAMAGGGRASLTHARVRRAGAAEISGRGR